MKLLDLVPPIISRSIEKILSTRKKNNNKDQFEKKFRSFEEALSYCSSLGYQNEELVDVVLKKTLLQIDQMIKKPYTFNSIESFYLFFINLLLSNHQDSIRILDVGGACGYVFFSLKRFIPDSCKIQWDVLETPAMVKKARENITSLSSEIMFYDNIRDIKKYRYDGILASGVLQFIPDLFIFLNEIINLNPYYIAIIRTPFLTEESDPIITIQYSKLSENGPGQLPDGFSDKEISYPSIFYSLPKLNDVLNKKYILNYIYETNNYYSFFDKINLINHGLIYKIKGN